MRNFIRKTQGRIYVNYLDDIQKVKDEIKEMNEFEYEYLPNDFIVLFNKYPETVYTGKFDDLDIDELTARCWKKGIYIFCYNEKDKDYNY
jgi:small-conductance mechanosensitive channel